ncbi:hypothetical protein J0910_31250 [Nocardiopsis sp. CNT-189]
MQGAEAPPPTGAPAPQPLIPAPAGPALPRRSTPPGSGRLWWLGVHGGAGESTLAALSGTAGAEHAWPVAETGRPAVVLVARTHLHGLERARQAATEWARGEVDVDLLGLALVADAPGRAPKALRDFSALVAGGLPRTWRIPWIEAWRAEPPEPSLLPRPVRRLLADTAALINPESGKAAE